MSNILSIDDRIEKLKKEWERQGHSPIYFYKTYIRPKYRLSYKRFLRRINWYGQLTYGIADAIEKYMNQNGKINQKTSSSRKKRKG